MATSLPKKLASKSGAAFIVRHAAIDDAAALVELSRRILTDNEGQVRLPDEMATSEEEQREQIGKYQEHPDWLFLVAEVDGAIVGCLDFKNGSQARIAHRGVLGMGVDPDWRDRGIGRGLLSTLIGWASEHSRIEKICLAVLATNTRAIALYEKMGFQEEGRRVREIRFGNNDYVDDILMYLFVDRNRLARRSAVDAGRRRAI